MSKIIKKADIILFIVLVLLGLGLSFVAFAGSRTPGSQILVSVGGKPYGTYDLSKDQTIEIEEDGHKNVILIEDGTAKMIEADCHNQLCIKQGAIHNMSESIVCLPNKVVIRVLGEEADVDAYSG